MSIMVSQSFTGLVGSTRPKGNRPTFDLEFEKRFPFLLHDGVLHCPRATLSLIYSLPRSSFRLRVIPRAMT